MEELKSTLDENAEVTEEEERIKKLQEEVMELNHQMTILKLKHKKQGIFFLTRVL